MGDINTTVSARQQSTFKRQIISFILNVVVIIFSITCIYPIFWMFYSAFKDTGDFSNNPVGFPARWLVDNYKRVITQTAIPRYMLNSAIITVISLAFILLIGFITGYFLSRFKFKGRDMLYAYFLVGMLIPIHALLVPMYIINKNLNLIDTRIGLALPYISFGLPMAIFLIESYVRSIPKEMEEAANIDGSSFSHTLFRIILPICNPILVAVGIIQFFHCWNEFSFALVLLNDPDKFTVPLGLTLFNGPYATNYPMIMAGNIVAIAPVIILYFSMSDKIISGMTAGAVKG